MNKILMCIFVMCLISCADNNESNIIEEETDIYNSDNKRKYRDMAFSAIESGNSELYKKASSWYILSKSPQDFISFATIMAMKHKNARAYHDIYYIYTTYHDINREDSVMVNFLLYNLAKSYELGFKRKVPSIKDMNITKENIESSDYYLEKLAVDNK